MQTHARVIFSTIKRLIHEYDILPGSNCNEYLNDWREVVLQIYRARKSVFETREIIWRISCTLALRGRSIDPTRAQLSLHPNLNSGFKNLVLTIAGFWKKPDPDTLRNSIYIISKEINRPCGRDRRIEEMLEALDKRMKIYGMIMGVLLPALFIASFYASILVGIIIVLIGATLWYAIRVDGLKYRELHLEDAWAKCTVSIDELERILKGEPTLPSVFEILGIPPPRLD